MPKFNVIPLRAYNTTKYSFYTKSKDDLSTVQNSGVMVEVEFVYFSRSKDKNCVLASRAYFGIIEEIM